MRQKKYPTIGTVLWLISLMLLVLPLASLYFLRIYESALVRQTESELIAQAAFISAMYQQEVASLLEKEGRPPESYGLQTSGESQDKDTLTPIFPILDLAKSPIYPIRPAPHQTDRKADPIALKAGQRVSHVFKNTQRITLSGMKVMDHHGVVVAGHHETGMSFAHTHEFQQARQGEAVRLLRQRNSSGKAPIKLGPLSRSGNMNVYVALPITLGDRFLGVVWVNRTPTTLMETLYNKRVELGWAAVFLVLATLAMTGLISWTITDPLHTLVQKTRRIEAGDPTGYEPLKHPMTREMDELSHRITAMAKTIEHRTDTIRTLTTHVSHEFKTPLTAIQGSVELLQDNLATMAPDKQQQFLSNIAADTDRLNRLVSRLMELARADIHQVSSQEKTPLWPILETVQQTFTTPAFQVTLPSEPMECCTTLSPDSLEAALTNLITNSQQAGATEVILQVTVKEDSEAESESIELTVKDNGPGISQGNRESIFTPFFTTKRDKGGTGLGLSIVQALLERQGGQIQLTSSAPETGTWFVLTLPT